MAFCRNCGSEIPEETRFCPNCGTSVEITEVSQVENREIIPVNEYEVVESESTLDKFGKYYGIILLILAFVDFQSDPAILTIVLSAAIIAGSIFCFSKKYKLKGFTVVALILSVFCLLSGISQAKKIGLFKIPGKDTKIEETAEIMPSSADITEDSQVIKEEPEVVEVVEESSEDSSEEASVVEEKETVNGVDPDLKAFLDSYEAFMDEYVDFMKKYMADPGNVISMLSEYTEIMEKYEDFADKIDKYDSDKMSTEDAKYYLEVVNRCNQKMLEIY